MKKSKGVLICVTALLSMLLNVNAPAQEKWSPAGDAFNTPEGTVAELYNAVSWEPGNPPDWNTVKKSFFIPETLIALRTARDKISVMNRDGFVELFIHDIKKYKLDETGFREKLVASRMTVFGDIAHCLTVYEASVPGSQRPPQRGVDSFQLLKKDGRWWIVSIINEVPTPGNPIPKDFLSP